MRLALFIVIATLSACSRPATDRARAALPEPVTNNAVAFMKDKDGRGTLYSFLGLGSGKTFEDITTRAFACVEASLECRRIGDVPVEKGRLASTAVALNDRIYLFGGYTVAEDGEEISTPEVFAFDPAGETYERRADMPTPVDDAVAFTYAGRYIYLVSGWHNDGNISLVQVFDAWEDKWFRATDYPGAPVFGHAGAASGGRFVIADGVALIGMKDGRRQFGAVDEVWLGDIDENDPAIIQWTKLPAHDGKPLYRMGAYGDAANNRIIFAGGSDNPYNYNGVGYDGVLSKPSGKVFAYDLGEDAWVHLGDAPPSMDHRGLVAGDEALYLIGGMGTEQQVLDTITRIKLE